MKRVCLVIAMTVAMAAAASAATSATGTNTVAPTMAVQVQVQTAVRLTFSAGATLVNGGAPCAIGGSVVVNGTPSDVSINFGPGFMDGLGISVPTCGGLVGTGASSATYATSYKIKPEWSGFKNLGSTITLTSAGFTNANTLSLVEGNAATLAALTAVPAAGNTHQIAIAAGNSGSVTERFMGVQVQNNDGTTNNIFPLSVGGAGPNNGGDAALVTFTMTVP